MDIYMFIYMFIYNLNVDKFDSAYLVPCRMRCFNS